MELDALKDRWQRRGAPEPEWRKAEAMSDLRGRMERLRRTAAARDLREAVAAFIVVGIFTWTAFVAPQPLARAGSIVIVISALFVVIWARVAGGRNRELETGLPVVEFFRRELRYVERQIRLLRSVFWWYIAPNLIGVELFFLGFRDAGRVIWLLLAFPVVIAVVVYWLNRLAARTHLEPLRDEIVRLLRDLEPNGV